MFVHKIKYPPIMERNSGRFFAKNLLPFKYDAGLPSSAGCSTLKVYEKSRIRQLGLPEKFSR
jgi:hypothetical protein